MSKLIDGLSIELAHDRQAVELSLDNDSIHIPLLDISMVIATLDTMREHLINRVVPPAPKPITMEEVGNPYEESDFALCGDIKLSNGEFEPWFMIAGYDVDFETIKKLHAWCGDTIKYVES